MSCWSSKTTWTCDRAKMILYVDAYQIRCAGSLIFLRKYSTSPEEFSTATSSHTCRYVTRDIFRLILEKFLFFNPLKLNVVCRLRQRNFTRFFSGSFICWLNVIALFKDICRQSTMLTTKVCVIRSKTCGQSEGGFIEMHTREQHGVGSRVAWTTLLWNTNTPTCASCYLSSSSLFLQSCRRVPPLSWPNFTSMRFTYLHYLRIEVGAWLRVMSCQRIVMHSTVQSYEARSRDTYKGSSYVLVFMDELSERTRSPLFKMNDPNNGTNPIEQISIQSKMSMRIAWITDSYFFFRNTV